MALVDAKGPLLDAAVSQACSPEQLEAHGQKLGLTGSESVESCRMLWRRITSLYQPVLNLTVAGSSGFSLAAPQVLLVSHFEERRCWNRVFLVGKSFW